MRKKGFTIVLAVVMILASVFFSSCEKATYEDVINKVFEEISELETDENMNVGEVNEDESFKDETSSEVIISSNEEEAITDIAKQDETTTFYEKMTDGTIVEIEGEWTTQPNNGIEDVVLDEEHTNAVYEDSKTLTESSKEEIRVTGVNMDKTSIVLQEGESEYISIWVSPSTASNKNLLLSSSNTYVATIDVFGKVTANGVGTATITAITIDGNFEVDCEVTVTSTKVSPTELTLNRNNLQLCKGNSEMLIATIYPKNVTDKNVIWSSSDTNVATVSNTGKVTAIGTGTAEITAKSVLGDKIARCKVVVISVVNSVRLNRSSITIKEGESATLVATINPTDASNKEVNWISSDNKVVAVDSNGKITAVGAGTATVTVKTKDGGKTAACNVTVKSNVTGVSITNKKQLALDVNDTYQCKILVSPSTAVDKSVEWSSSDSSIAKVSADGKITALKCGVATITVKTNDGNKMDSIKVYVYQSGVQITTDSNIWYRISLASTHNRVMDVSGRNTYNGAKVVLNTLDGTNQGVWQFHNYNGANGYNGVVIVPYCNSAAYILDVNRGGNNYTDPFKENNLIDLWFMGSDVQASQWTLVRMYDGSYIFKLYGTDWVAGVTSTNTGAQLMLRKFDVFDQNQKWFLESVNTGSSDRGITSKLNEAKALYPNGSSRYDWYNAAGKLVGYQCHGYARWLSEYVWGTDFANGYGKGWSLIMATASNSQIDRLSVGDVVRYRGAGDYNHTIFITAISGNTIYYTDCNSDGYSSVYWNKSIDKTSLAQKLTKVLSTKFGGESNTYGYIAHYNK